MKINSSIWQAKTFALAIFLSLSASHVAAQDTDGPLSIIDWLGGEASTSSGAASNPNDELSIDLPVPSGGSVPDVTSEPLNESLEDGAGIVSAEAAQLPDLLWATSETDALVAALSQVPSDLTGEARDLFYRLLLTSSSPPLGAGTEGRWLAARVDRLIDMGALEQALALLEAAAPTQPALFERWFDVAVLLDRPQTPCAALQERPSLSFDADKRVFCLTRDGDWTAAVLTLQTSRILGEISDADAALLTAFLDPAIADTLDLSPSGAPMDPLEVHMRRAIGQSITVSNLPVAFAVQDLNGEAGRAAQLEAAERLARTGAIAPEILFSILTSSPNIENAEGTPDIDPYSAQIIGALRQNLAVRDHIALGPVLQDAWATAIAGGFGHAFAKYWGAELSLAALDRDASELVRELYAIIGYFTGLERSHARASGARQRDLARIALGQTPLIAVLPAQQGVTSGLNRRTVDPHIASLQAEGKIGEALLVALAQLGDGKDGNLSELSSGIASLRGLGFEESARRVALDFWVGI